MATTMATPIDMKPRKRHSFRVTRSPRPKSFLMHPLELPDLSDSEVESVLDSYNESVLSLTSFDLLLLELPLLAGCMAPATPAVVLIPLVTAVNAVPPVVMPTHSKLLALLREDRKQSKSNHKSSNNCNYNNNNNNNDNNHSGSNGSSGSSGSSGYAHFNLFDDLRGTKHNDTNANEHENESSQSTHTHAGRWRTFAGRLMALTLVPLSPRSTDDGPHIKYTPEQYTPPVAPPQELVTFESRTPAPMGLARTHCKARNRDFRINSEFLRRYALDYAARQTPVLPTLGTVAEHEQLMRVPALHAFHERHGIHRVSALSRDKLWELVVLPPRADATPSRAVDYSSYVREGTRDTPGRGGTLVCKYGSYIPWATHRTALKPAGVMSGVRPLASKAAPTQRATPTQYTIRGWANARWQSD